MNISLTDKLEKFIRAQVDSGLYNNASEVLRDAVRLLMKQDEERRIKIDQLRKMGEAGEKDLAAGRVVTLKSAKDMDKFFRSL